MSIVKYLLGLFQDHHFYAERRGDSCIAVTTRDIQRLKIVFIASCYDDIIDLEHHAAELCSEQELLAFSDQRINDKVLTHI